MSNRPGALVYDPALEANDDEFPTGTGGGEISGAGTYYSHASELPGGRAAVVTDDVFIDSTSGPLTGTITVEVSNGSHTLDLAGTARWQTYTLISPIAIAGDAHHGIQRKMVGWARTRLKFVVTSGAGTIEDRRVTVSV